MTFVASMVDALIRGVDGRRVIEDIRAHYKTQYSFEKNVSNVRRQYLTRGPERHPTYEADLRLAAKLARKDSELVKKIDCFANMTLEEQYDTLQQTRKYGFAPESEKLSACLASMHLLAENMHSFALTKGDLQENARLKHNTLLSRNSVSIKLSNPKEVLEQQLELLASSRKCGPRHILALLLVSGRRETELLNGKSTFERVPGHPYYARFGGVLKKRRNPLQADETSFRIPLLCRYTVFSAALARLRSRQKPDIQQMTNKQVSRRYCSQLCSAAKKTFPMLTKPHDLRAVYVRYVELLFTHEVAFPLLCMKSLGHETMADTLHYMSVTFTGPVPTKSLGALLL